jgi:hypothetical protein
MRARFSGIFSSVKDGSVKSGQKKTADPENQIGG